MPNPPVELKPCALCGGEAESSTGSTKGNPWEFVECINCGATSESIALWNTRPIEDALTARVKALEKAGDALYRRLEDISEDGEAIDQWAALAEGGGD